MRDIRDEILRTVEGNHIVAAIIADDDGMVVETTSVTDEARKLGLNMIFILDEGSPVKLGDEIVRFSGTPKQVVVAEEVLIGLMAKPSGISTAARRFVEKAGDKPKIVSGAWKKMPSSQKEAIRRAVVTGGAFFRMSRNAFVYLDKNYIKMLGGIKKSLEAVAHLSGHEKVAQLKGRHADIVSEAREALQYNADILHVDTGQPDDVKMVVDELIRLGMREKVKIAFSGGVRLEDMDMLKTLDIDILDIGRQIVDAPLLDMRMEVIDK
ncbi:MAG: quinolinate phosphoribosyl transferase [Deltaproteobacteria bacterium]|nr:quinolinate phosphoribosyl transferase [Deltaproteobacteria bacterium]MBW2143807.1 quinolinate phosphoribosyl transferase [Deltaproteobacteria bacterium]